MKIEVNKISKTIQMKNVPHDTFAVIVEGGYAGSIVFRPWSVTYS